MSSILIHGRSCVSLRHSFCTCFICMQGSRQEWLDVSFKPRVAVGQVGYRLECVV